MNRSQLELYAVTDRRWLVGRTLPEAVREALEGGATMIQLREKSMEREAMLNEAREIGAICRSFNVPFIIDDDVETALDCGADGVHVGQEDMEAGLVRRRVGKNRIVGVSAHSVEEALRAQAAGADYLGCGAVFPTATHDRPHALPIPVLRDICRAVSIPVAAIGGIKLENVDQLAGTGIAGVAVVTALFAAADVRESARRMREKLGSVL